MPKQGRMERQRITPVRNRRWQPFQRLLKTTVSFEITNSTEVHSCMVSLLVRFAPIRAQPHSITLWQQGSRLTLFVFIRRIFVASSLITHMEFL